MGVVDEKALRLRLSQRLNLPGQYHTHDLHDRQLCMTLRNLQRVSSRGICDESNTNIWQASFPRELRISK